MLYPVRVLLLSGFVRMPILIKGMSAQVGTGANAALVLAVDIPYSIAADGQELQREDFVGAFLSSTGNVETSP